MNFNSIGFAPKLTNCFQTWNMLVPKAHGQAAPTQATQYTPRIWQNSQISFLPSQTSPWGARQEKNIKKRKNRLHTYFQVALVPIAKLWKKITFCIFQESLVQAWANRLCFYCFSYPNQAVCIDLHPHTHRVSTRADSALRFHTRVLQLCSKMRRTYKPALRKHGELTTPVGKQGKTHLSESMHISEHVAHNVEAKMMRRMKVCGSRALCRQHPAQGQDRQSAKEIQPELCGTLHQIFLLYPQLKHGLTSAFISHSHKLHS